MTDSLPEVHLQPRVEQLITKICTDRRIPSPDVAARRLLSTISEESAIEILNKIAVSREIRDFSRFIAYMVKKTTASVAVSSPTDGCVLPQKRSPPISFTDGSPLKHAHYISPDSKKVVESPGSSLNYRAIPDYFPVSPNDGYGSSVSKIMTSLEISGLKDASPNQRTLSPCSSSKGTQHPSHFYDISSAMHNSSLIPDQRSLSPCVSIGGPTNTLPNHSKINTCLTLQIAAIVFLWSKSNKRSHHVQAQRVHTLAAFMIFQVPCT
ncbi:LOW QUALITY PROTEIN: hypothetical protein M8C21_001954, partial [Ambrosia artemisiifolia]